MTDGSHATGGDWQRVDAPALTEARGEARPGIALDDRTMHTAADPEMMQDLLVEQLADLLHAEGQLVKALPKMERAANSPRLKQAFADHLEETREQTERLKEVFVLLGAEAKAKPCRGMAGLLEEGDEVIEEGEEKDPVAADLALIAASQKVEHYEISAYGTARSLAGQAGLPAASMLLSTSLAEEEIADNLLTQIARELMSESGDTAIRGGGEPETKERQFNAPEGNGQRQGKTAKSKSH